MTVRSLGLSEEELQAEGISTETKKIGRFEALGLSLSLPKSTFL